MDNQEKQNKQAKQDNKKKRNPLWLVIITLIIIIILLLLRSCGTEQVVNQPVNEPVIEEPIGNFEVGEQKEKPVIEVEEKEIPSITFAGYGKYNVSEEYPNVEMKNPADNFVDMVFTLSDTETGELIARTGKVKSGDFVYVNVMDFYKKVGVYNVSIDIATYDSETGAQMNGMHQEMEIVVE